MADRCVPRNTSTLSPESMQRCMAQVEIALLGNHPAQAHAAITEAYIMRTPAAVDRNSSVAQLNLPPRTVSILEGLGMETVGELAARTSLELRAMYQVGDKMIGEIEVALSETRFRLRR